MGAPSPLDVAGARMSRRPKLLFLALEGWFVRSHFLPMVKRAADDGYEVVVCARIGDSAEALLAAGADPRVDPAAAARIFRLIAITADERMRNMLAVHGIETPTTKPE